MVVIMKKNNNNKSYDKRTSNFEKKQVNAAFFAYSDHGISAQRTLVAVNYLCVIFSTWWFCGLDNCVLANITEEQSNKTKKEDQ